MSLRSITLLALLLVVAILGANGQQLCGRNARNVECGTNCPVNCQNVNNQPAVCNFACFVGCRCQEGFIFRSGSSGDCVAPQDCPK